METDIAVIEQYLHQKEEWEILSYLGPDRTEGIIDIFQSENSITIRIRYLKGEK